jgi:tripartite-type tricarboxylate transporter receptor subunit TctC
MIVPYPPGGGTDITARVIAHHLADFLGQPVLIENRPGATGMIGAESVVRSVPDGYTVLFGAASEMGINASLYKKMAYDPRAHLEAVSLIATFPLVFVAPASTPDSLVSLIEAARRKPGSVTYGSIGQGSPQHLAGELLSSMAKATFTHIPYKGSGPLVQDAIGGHIDMAISSLPAAVPMVKSGKLRALAVTSLKRASALPEVPTMAELGYPGYELSTWVGAAVPVGTPKNIVARLHEGLTKVLAIRDVQAALLAQGAEPIGSTPEHFREFVRQEIAKSDRIVTHAGIRLDN